MMEMKLTIKNNGTMNIVQTLDESTVSVPVDYTIDMEHKRFTNHERRKDSKTG